MGNEDYPGYDRLTRILDCYKPQGLIDWEIKVGKKEARRIKTVATKIGTNVDEYIKAEILGKRLPKLKSIEAETCVLAWNKWKADYGVDPKHLKVGQRIFCDITNVTGEPDIEVLLNDEVLDIKCSTEIRPSYWIQTNWLANQLGRKWRSVLRLDKNLGIYEYERRPLSDDDTIVFHALTVIYRYFKPEQEPEDEPSTVTES